MVPVVVALSLSFAAGIALALGACHLVLGVLPREPAQESTPTE